MTQDNQPCISCHLLAVTKVEQIVAQGAQAVIILFLPFALVVVAHPVAAAAAAAATKLVGTPARAAAVVRPPAVAHRGCV